MEYYQNNNNQPDTDPTLHPDLPLGILDSTVASNNLSLREILTKYGKDKQLLQTILIAKTEQDRLEAEALRHQTELIKLENKRIDQQLWRYTEYEQNQSNYQFLPVSPNSIDRSFMNQASPTILDGFKIAQINRNGMRNMNPNPFTTDSSLEDRLTDPNSPKNTFDNKDNNELNGGNPHANGGHERKLSREEVLQKLRDKVRQNSISKMNHPTLGSS